MRRALLAGFLGLLARRVGLNAGLFRRRLQGFDLRRGTLPLGLQTAAGSLRDGQLLVRRLCLGLRGARRGRGTITILARRELFGRCDLGLRKGRRLPCLVGDILFVDVQRHETCLPAARPHLDAARPATAVAVDERVPGVLLRQHHDFGGVGDDPRVT